jgi:hypothetical protein
MNINGANSATEMDSDAKEMNAYLTRILSSLSGEIDRMRGLVEASRGRIDSKSSWKGNAFHLICGGREPLYLNLFTL